MTNHDMTLVTVEQAKITIAAEARRIGHKVEYLDGISNLQCTTDKRPSFFVGAVQDGKVWIPDYRSHTMIQCQTIFGGDVDIRLVIGVAGLEPKTYRLNYKGMQFIIVDGEVDLYGRIVSTQMLKKYIDRTLELID